MHDKTNLSILTNFGCPYECKFCISSSQNSKNVYKFKLQDVRDIRKLLKSREYSRLSVSGGGDPLYIHNKDIELLYKFIIKESNTNNIHLSFHTNFQYPPQNIRKLLNRYLTNFVISIHSNDFERKFYYWTSNGTYSGDNLRFTYVIGYNHDDLELIKKMLMYLPSKSKLTLKQLDGTVLDDIMNIKEILDLIKDNEKCILLPSGDYNMYYNLRDNKTYTKFKDIQWKNA